MAYWLFQFEMKQTRNGKIKLSDKHYYSYIQNNFVNITIFIGFLLFSCFDRNGMSQLNNMDDIGNKLYMYDFVYFSAGQQPFLKSTSEELELKSMWDLTHRNDQKQKYISLYIM